MRRFVIVAAWLVCASCSRDRAAPSPAQDSAPAAKAPSPFETFETTAPRPGEAAPDFTLADLDGKPVTLRDATARGPVVLVFGSFT